MSMIPTTTNSAEWTPPQAKAVKIGINIAIGAALLAGSVFAINTFVPDLTLAVTNLMEFVQSLTGLAVSVAVLFGLAIIVMQFFPGGKIHKLIGQAYDSFVNQMTWALLDIDPITPLEDAKREAVREKATYDEGFAKFDGVISAYERDARAFDEAAKQAEKEAKTAKQRWDAGEARFKMIFEAKSYDHGQNIAAAERFRTRIAELVPVRATIKELSEVADVLISNIDTDIRIQKKEWDAQKAMGAMDKAARSLLKGSEKKELAQKAAQLINTKYAYQMGRLRNLADTSRNLIDSVDLQKGSYSQDLLAKWQQDTVPTLTQQSAAPMPMLQDQASAYAKLVR